MSVQNFCSVIPKLGHTIEQFFGVLSFAVFKVKNLFGSASASVHGASNKLGK